MILANDRAHTTRSVCSQRAPPTGQNTPARYPYPRVRAMLNDETTVIAETDEVAAFLSERKAGDRIAISSRVKLYVIWAEMAEMAT